MDNKSIIPEKITKPIQLLAAWLAGLLAIDTCFLIAAARIGQGSWESMALVVAAIVNVPIFLAAVFLLQTKFRPELQEDSYYSSYLSQKTNEIVSLTKDEKNFLEIRQKLAELESRVIQKEQAAPQPLTVISTLRIGINRHLPQIDDIKTKLSQLGVIGYSVFGTDEAPEKNSVAISVYVPDEAKKEIVKLARDLGFAHYAIFNNIEEEVAEEVLFGAYGTPEFDIV